MKSPQRAATCMACVAIAGHLEGEHAAKRGHLPGGDGMPGMVGQPGIVHGFHLRMRARYCASAMPFSECTRTR